MEDNVIRSSMRILTLIELLARHGAMGVTELSVAANLNKAAVYRQLNTLAAMGYVKKQSNTEKYRLTFKLLEVASGILEHTDMRTAARPHLEWLAKQTGEAVHLVQRDGNHIIYIDKVEPTVNSVRMVSRVGMLKPLYCTAVGKAIAAELSDSEIKQVWESSDIRPLTPHTLVKFEDFIEDLDKTRRRGYALDNEENELGVLCVAVALKAHADGEQYAVSVSSPSSRMSPDRIEIIKDYLLKLKSDI